MTNDIEQIKSKLNIVDIISSYVPTLKRAGSSFSGLCPFHKEKTPSFHVNEKDQYFKCFGCGEKGDIFTFIQKIENIDFKAALELLAEKAGVELNSSESSNRNKEKVQRLIQANELASKYYNYILSNHHTGEEGREYALKRGLNAQIIADFRVGFAPENKYNLRNFMLSKGFDAKELVEFGLVVERNGELVDKFRHRLLQPIFSLNGQVIGFSGRYIGQSKDVPKYLNSPETEVYKKNEVLYSLYHAKEAIKKLGYAIIVEGNLDVLSSHRVNVSNIVAPLGTAFTESQARLLKRYTDKLYFCFDSDEAGLKALIRSLAIAEIVGFEHKVVELGGNQDADQYITQSKNPQKDWFENVNNPTETMEYIFRIFAAKTNPKFVSGKVIFKKNAFEVLKHIQNDVLFFHYAKELSLILEVPEVVILDELTALRQKSKSAKGQTEIELHIDKTKEQTNNNINYNFRKRDYIYFISLIINSTKRYELDFPKNGFLENIFFQRLLNFTIENYDNLDYSKFPINEDAEISLLEEFLAFDELPDINVIDKELEKYIKIFWREHIDRELMHLRSLLEDENNSEQILRINELSALKKKYN